jgi:hypothetical protein
MRSCITLVSVLFWFSFGLTGQTATPAFANLQTFLNVCPQDDPAYNVLRRDFQILRDRAPAGEISCAPPYTRLPVSQITDELTTLQTLRFAYYMDLGRSAYLPWTRLRLYDWIKSGIAGFDIDTKSGANSPNRASCCVSINGLNYISLSPDDEANRLFRLSVIGLAGRLALFAHETRHTEGFGHSGCCGWACDQTYDETNLSPFGIQYYLFKQWLTGDINLGVSCDPVLRAETVKVFLQVANGYHSAFCDVKPAILTMPASPGGVCPAAAVSNAQPDQKSLKKK